MEKLVRVVLAEYFEKHGLLTPSQHGFVRKKSCLTNLLETKDYLTKAKANKKDVDMILLDFAKAFDKVAHGLLLQGYGICGDLLKWIKAFPSNRKQRDML